MKRKKHAAEIRTKILKTTRELLQEHGYQKTTTRMIIKECGIRNSSLYHFFANKEDILLHISLVIIEKVRELIQGRFAKNPEAAFLHELCWYYFSLLENTRNTELYLIAFRSYPISKAIQSNILASLTAFKGTHSIVEKEAIISMALGYLQAIGEKFIHQEPFDQYQSIQTLFELLLRALGYADADSKAVIEGVHYQEMEQIVPNYSILSSL